MWAQVTWDAPGRPRPHVPFMPGIATILISVRTRRPRRRAQAAGNVTSMTVPFSESTSRTDPPIARASDSTIDIPRPEEP